MTPQRPWRRLVLLALAVLAVHAVLLGLIPWPSPQPLTLNTPTLRLRQLTPPASQQETPAPAPTAAQARPGTPPPAVRASQNTASPPAETAQAPRTSELAEAAAQNPEAADAAPRPAPALIPMATDTNFGEPPGLTAVLPDPVRVHYDVALSARGLTLPAQARLDWSHDGGRYQARLEISGALALLRRVQTSIGSVTPQGLAPQRFSEQGRRGEEATHFDHDTSRVIFSNNRPQADLPAGAQDRLSVLIQLSMLIGSDPRRYTTGTAVAIPTAGTRELETWVFTVLGEEELRLPGGTVRALKFQRNPRRDFDLQVELWLAPGMDYAPVRVRLTLANGDSSDLLWRSTERG